MPWRLTEVSHTDVGFSENPDAGVSSPEIDPGAAAFRRGGEGTQPSRRHKRTCKVLLRVRKVQKIAKSDFWRENKYNHA